MQIRDVGVSIVFVLLFWSFLGMTLEDKKVIRGLLSGFNLNSAYEDSNENLEVLAFSCKLELLHVKQVYENLNNQELTTDNIREALNNLDFQKKQNLFKCLRDNYVISPISGDDARPINWFHKNLNFHFEKLTSNVDSRRLLAQAPSKSPGSKRKAPPTKDAFVIPISTSDSPPEKTTGGGDSTKAASEGGSGGGGGAAHDPMSVVVVVVVVTAIVTFFMALILFCCCRKAFGGGSGLELKDDRPLLSLSRSDYSGSPNAWNSQNSFHKENKGNNLSTTPIDSTTIENSNMSTNNNIINNNNINNISPVLKPPPGRTGGRDPGLPPLKPPPGRAQPLPPEPRASLRRASSKGDPSPQPPPPKPPVAAPPPPPPPKNSGLPTPGPPPPPPVRGGKAGPGPPPPPMKKSQLPRVAVKGGSSSCNGDDSSKTKLKPFHWDKVQANPEHSMVWDQLKAGSFVFNEEMIESLFGYAQTETKKDKKKQTSDQPQFIQLIDKKKAQNLAILLRATNFTSEEVRDAVTEGNELPSELLETLLKMAPTQEEELKLRLFSGEISQLGQAERFLKVLVDIPFIFKRLETLLFMGTLHEEATSVKEALITLEAACKELRNSRLFLKLLEAVLKTGNRMNVGTYRGGAQAFKLDTLLKLADVKGTDGKTTLLHFVVQEIIRSEGVRAARTMRESQSFSSIKSEDLLEDVNDDSEEHYRTLGLDVVSGLSDQLGNVKRAACLDSDTVTGTLSRLGNSLLKAKNFLGKEMKELDENSGFHDALKSFVEDSEGNIMTLLEEEKRIMALVKHTGDYFHGSSEKEEGLRLFVIVRDFLIMLDKACKEVKEKPKWPSREQKKRDPPTRQTSTETPRTPFSPDFRQKLFPAIAERRKGDDGFSSDED